MHSFDFEKTNTPHIKERREYVIDIYLADIPSSSWVFDTRSVVHICNSMQGLVRTRRVGQGEIDIRVSNKARVVALEVGTMQLQLPSRFIIGIK